MRLFTAVMLPDVVSSHLDAALGGIGGSLVADPGAGLRWVPRKQRHLTLAFHGNVPDGAVPGYIDGITRAFTIEPFEPFQLALAGGGSFSGRTLYAGVGEGTRQLQKLSAIVEEAAAEAGLWPDKNAGGRPHVTLARASSNRGESHHRRAGRRNSGAKRGAALPDEETPVANLEAWAHALSIYRGPTFTVDAIEVIQSELGKGPASGPLHTPVATIPLSAAFSDAWEYRVPDAEDSKSAGARLNYPLNYERLESQPIREQHARLKEHHRRTYYEDDYQAAVCSE